MTTAEAIECTVKAIPAELAKRDRAGWTCLGGIVTGLTLVSTAGDRIYCGVIEARGRERIRFAGVLPRHDDDSLVVCREHAHTERDNTVLILTSDKRAACYASAITKRLLPGYRRWLNCSRTLIQTRRAEKDAQARNANKVLEAMQTSTGILKRANHAEYTIISEHGVSVDVKASSQDVDLNITSVPVDLAIAIGQLIRSHHARYARA